MKKLLYKEFVLCMHPLCYIFSFVFPLMFLIPNYPLFVGTLYIIPMFSVLFVGVQKGVQSHDLFYTALLPIRKRDIVKARMASVVTMEVATLSLMALLTPAKLAIIANMPTDPSVDPYIPGLNSIDGLVSSFAFVIVGYLMVNAIFFLMFYKKGRSITAPTLISTFGYIIYIAIFTLILPGFAPGFQEVFVLSTPAFQCIFLGVAIVLYIVGMYLIYRKASQELEQADL
ncbi:MAG: ABC-2 transporter permease [Bacilli bacterium]|nr:ABC-2 transporter permease [Bacilli bacterium]